MGIKAVVDGLIKHVSASQISTFELCQRKWWYEKIAGIKPPPSESTAVGESIHTQIEQYYETNGAVLPAHASARDLLQRPEIPQPGPGLLIEVPRNRQMSITYADVPVQGRIDLLNLRQLPDGLVTVVDWKSAGSTRYLKKPQELADNTQLTTYGKWVFDTYPEATHVSYVHGYVFTRKTGSKVVPTPPLPKEQVLDTASDIDRTVGEMKRVARLTEAQDVLPTLDACDAYGGCPYQSRCEALEWSHTGGDWLAGLGSGTGGDWLAAICREEIDVPIQHTPEGPIAVGVLPPDAPPAEKSAPPPVTKTEEPDGPQED